jgi:predicted naringenin-chalcone synthase
MSDAHIAGMGIALPVAVPTPRFLEVDARARRAHGHTPETIDAVRRICEGSRIATRHSVVPAWHPEGTPDTGVVDVFAEHDFDPPAHLRAKLWHELAPRYAIEAARRAIADWGGDVRDITHVVTTSTTGWAEPGIAVALIDELGLSLDTCKIEININGCFCAASCLRTARDIVRGGEAGAVLVVAVELASLQYDPVDDDMSTLVSMALFSDGAGAMIVAPTGRWEMARAGMSLVPKSRHLLRLNPSFEKEHNTVKMHLDAAVPSALAGYFSDGRGAALLESARAWAPGLPALAVHPGGPKILDALVRVFASCGWPEDALASSFATLEHTGNLGSAAVLFVLHRLLRETRDDRVLMLAFGPGVTVEWGLLRRVA